MELEGLTRKPPGRGLDETATQPQDWFIWNLADLRETKWDSMADVFGNAEHRRPALKLRFAVTAKDSQVSDTRWRYTAIAKLKPRGDSQQADAIAGGSLEAAKLGKAPREASGESGLEPDGATTGGPRSKMPEVAARAGTAEQIQRFEDLTAGANVLRSRESGLKCVAPGIRSSGCSCEVAGRRHLPPFEDAVMARSGNSSAARKF